LLGLSQQIPSDPKSTGMSINNPTQQQDNAPQKSASISEIVFINLDSRPDRAKLMEDSLAKWGIAFSRKSALKFESYESALNDQQYGEYFRNRKMASGINPRKKAFLISCYMSHYTTYQHFASLPKSDENKYYLILEDDHVLVDGWKEKFANMMQFVPSDFDVLRLATWGARRPEDSLNLYVTKATSPFIATVNGERSWFYGGTHAVVVQSSTLPSFIKKLDSIPMTDIDEMMTNCCTTIKSYALKESLMKMVDHKSDHPSLMASDEGFRPTEDEINTKNVVTIVVKKEKEKEKVPQ